MQDYNLVLKRNPMKPDEAKKWYAVPQSRESQDTKTMTRAATENTTTAPIEMETAIDLFGKYAVQQLLQGHTVRVGNLGSLRITFKSEGVENINNFNAGTMIKKARVVFAPTKELRDSVVRQLKFQNGGVLEDGVNYASLADYRKAKGISAGGGGSNEDEGEDPSV
ncbi:HU family DNA-binding protein [Bacteroides salyersiae]|uniref:HU domain-containing protein n=1 Tax=Bacteroides salyersiae TaxID=291644 RepID=A0A7J4XLU2_9BACE|nr:hypothetical protein [Bacteroides salyersiae]KAA3694776.1 hypothetical protein F3F90_02285 [Bacteroides salyersiae]KAA3696552.1 hypothetical protein F3F88_15060 [Bacteroides salyersiae]KAA3698170.1 hypothetical protein F3F89_07200 [Bacteroides salyersiae]KAA3704804.1 hypothetical protein F3F83_15555 [Bacteroides salyersiae]KAA3711880.1 hypothetical protein F3G09_09075 [Bacteroides salyersiae]